ncbi:NAD-dependent epimerase/dehydratase family protein [Rhizobiaceae bacterium BDR2-2]|uniref:NAD-dependent epimerase/dehydratase family protein n=1 Tax=Ectorhizobium quercum TaxID=2965071 RepID=A0AAE3MZ30_9HYPH|nr:NAD-dependent epimerase/dehydratase family protein [Ectorhizobium quercum]MCX8997908.1 NAD-dependent epimerase/dehydratase family protein [Ectorhizobium quercum]
MSEAIVVFGGSGFVGTHLIRKLAAAGERVVSLDLKPQRETLAGVDYRIGDVRDLENFQVEGPVRRIYNFAAVHTTPGHPFWEYYDTNINGAIEVTRWANAHDVPQIVFTSSISVYGPAEEVKTEASQPAPESAYGYSKLMAESVHRIWFDARPGRKLVVARPAVVFGHGERGNFTRLARLLQKGFFVYPGRKDTVKACVYVEDLLDSMDFALAEPDAAITYNAAYPERYTLEEIVDTLRAGHFPAARTWMIPRIVVVGAAAILGRLGAFNLGIHPERVMKLVRSTDVFPAVLTGRGYRFPFNLKGGLAQWAPVTDAAVCPAGAAAPRPRARPGSGKANRPADAF